MNAMKTIGEKIKERREFLGLTQPQLAERADITIRSISRYETAQATPRGITLNRLAAALDVSVEYLIDPEATDPEYGKEEAPYVDAYREKYGRRDGKKLQRLLSENLAMLAGGGYPQEDKDAFVAAIVKANEIAKIDSSERFNPHKNGN